MQVNSLVKSVKIKHIAAVLSAVTIVGCSRIPELPTELPGPISLPEQPAEPAATPPTPLGTKPATAGATNRTCTTATSTTGTNR